MSSSSERRKTPHDFSTRRRGTGELIARNLGLHDGDCAFWLGPVSCSVRPLLKGTDARPSWTVAASGAAKLACRHRMRFRGSFARNVCRPRPYPTPIALRNKTQPDDHQLAGDKGEKHSEGLIHEAV
jgi:hypothetical protein